MDAERVSESLTHPLMPGSVRRLIISARRFNWAASSTDDMRVEKFVDKVGSGSHSYRDPEIRHSFRRL